MRGVSNSVKDITAVTGPLRSGTSCVTGALERCGIDLGRNVRILRRETPLNPRGHFEPDLLFAVNERLLAETIKEPWSVTLVPGARELADLAGRRDRYFALFIRRFDGELFKDPLLCLTLPFWESRWPALGRAVFCLRHPLAVARSIEKRYRVPVVEGLELWRAYTVRFFDGGVRSDIYVLDFDALVEDPVGAFSALLGWLDRPAGAESIRENLAGFFDPAHVEWRFGAEELGDVPGDVADLYVDIRARAGAPARGAASHG